MTVFLPDPIITYIIKVLNYPYFCPYFSLLLVYKPYLIAGCVQKIKLNKKVFEL